jgi:SAM-dependent methyltransferase
MENSEWYKDEYFWSAFASVMFDERRWAEVPGVCDLIEKILGKPEPARTPVLDALCGVGRVSIELASRGYPVTGVDLSPRYLEAARSCAEGLPCEFIESDIRDFCRPGAYRLAIDLYNSFGYLETPAEDLRMLTSIRRSLVPGGCFIMEMFGKETVARDFKDNEWWERDGVTVMAETAVLGAWEGLRSHWRVIEGERTSEYRFDQRLYSGTELERALVAAGFSEVSIHGALDLRPYDQNADNLVALARA